MRITIDMPRITATDTPTRVAQIVEYLNSLSTSLNFMCGNIDTDNLSSNLLAMLGTSDTTTQVATSKSDSTSYLPTSGGNKSLITWDLSKDKWTVSVNEVDKLVIDPSSSTPAVFNGNVKSANGSAYVSLTSSDISESLPVTYGSNTYEYTSRLTPSNLQISYIVNGTTSSSMVIDRNSIVSSGHTLNFSSGSWNGSASSATTADTLTSYYSTTAGADFTVQMSTASRSFIPTVDQYTHLGSASGYWADIYAVSSTITTSDQNKKHDIADLTDKHLQLILKIAPKSFVMNDGESGRTHIGFIAQDVKACMDEVGLTDMDFAGWIKDVDVDGNETYGLRYEEFISMLTYAVQSHEKRLNDLETKVNALINSQEGE